MLPTKNRNLKHPDSHERWDMPLESTAPAQPSVRPEHVHGIVLAGVHAWGSCPLEQTVPRPLLPVADRPLICHILDWFGSAGIADTTVCANSDTVSLRRRLSARTDINVNIDYFEDVMPRGPAGCARDAALLTRDRTGDFIVADGTILPRINLAHLLDHHRRSHAALTIVVAGDVRTNDRHAGILEPVGIYVFSSEALREVPPQGYQDIKERLIPQLHKSGHKVVPYGITRDQALRVTGAESYLDINRRALEWFSENPLPGDRPYSRIQEAIIHRTATVASTARIVGPVLIGPEAVIGEGVMLVGPTSIGARCTVSRNAVISRSALWDDCAIGAETFLDHCIVADQAEVEAGIVSRDVLWLTSNAGSIACLGQSLLQRLRFGINLRRAAQAADIDEGGTRSGKGASQLVTYAVSLED